MILRKIALLPLLPTALAIVAAGCSSSSDTRQISGPEVSSSASLAAVPSTSPDPASRNGKTVVDADSTDPDVQKAVELYKKNCLVCHGPQLEGVMPRTKMDQVGSKLTSEEIKDKIMTGGKGMIAYKNRLSDEEVGLLTDWLASKK